MAVALGWAMRRKPFSRFNEYVGSASNTCWFARALELRTLLIASRGTISLPGWRCTRYALLGRGVVSVMIEG